MAVAAAFTAAALAGCTAQTKPDAILKVWGPVLAPEATEIAICESDLNPKAVSKTNDHGLFQINIVHKESFTDVTGQPWSAIYDPVWNAKFAKWLWTEQGWKPWVCKYVLGL